MHLLCLLDTFRFKKTKIKTNSYICIIIKGFIIYGLFIFGVHLEWFTLASIIQFINSELM